jgi:hypothetical protein
VVASANVVELYVPAVDEPQQSPLTRSALLVSAEERRAGPGSSDHAQVPLAGDRLAEETAWNGLRPLT